MSADTGSADTTGPVRSVARALDVLEAMAEIAEPVTLSEIAKLFGNVPRSTLHDILRTLHTKGWVEAAGDGPRYNLSIKTLQLGRSYLDASKAFASYEQTLDAVAERVDETVHLGRLFDTSIVYIGKRDPSHAIRLYSAIGRSLPAHATALGKSLLARRPDPELSVLLPERLEALTEQTIVDREKLLLDLAEIRERGYAIDNEESMDGVLCYAVALSDREAISVSMLKWRTGPDEREKIIETLLEVAATADSGTLG